jgi:hypothetical protein
VPRNPRDLQLPPKEEYGELRETGVFVAPPRTGVTQGPINRMGVEGLTLSLPEIRITTPRVEFPSFFHSRSESRMILDRAHAPYVHTGYQYTGAAVQAPAGNRDIAPPAQSRDLPPQSCEEQLRELQEKYRELEQQSRQLERALEQQRDLQQRDLQQRGPTQAPSVRSRLIPSSEKQSPPLPPPDDGSRRRLDHRAPQIESVQDQNNFQPQSRPVGYSEAAPSPQAARRPIMEPAYTGRSVIQEPIRPISQKTALAPKWLRLN